MLSIIFEVILFLISVSIYITVILQGGKAQGLGGTLTGKSDSNLFQNIKPNHTDKMTFRITITLIFIFFTIGFLMCVLIKHNIIHV